MAPFNEDLRSLLFARGGLMEILDAGGDESNNEKRRNILFAEILLFSLCCFKEERAN